MLLQVLWVWITLEYYSSGNKLVESSLSSWLMAAFGNSSVAMKFHYCFSPWPFFITILMHQECMYDLLLLPSCLKLSWCCTWIFKLCNQNCCMALSKNTWGYIIRAFSAKSKFCMYVTCANLSTHNRRRGSYNGTIIFEIDIMKKSFLINLKFTSFPLSKPKWSADALSSVAV